MGDAGRGEGGIQVIDLVVLEGDGEVDYLARLVAQGLHMRAREGVEAVAVAYGAAEAQHAYAEVVLAADGVLVQVFEGRERAEDGVDVALV